MSARWRTALAIVLFAAASAWPLLNLGPRRPTLFTIAGTHGIDASDAFSLIPFVAALIVLHGARRSWRHSALTAAAGLSLGVAFAVVIYLLR